MLRYGWTTTSHGSGVQSKFTPAQWEGKSSRGQDWRQTCSRNRVAPGSWCTTMVLALQHRSVLVDCPNRVAARRRADAYQRPLVPRSLRALVTTVAIGLFWRTQV